MECSINLNDLFEELIEENKRISKQLLNSNQIILILNKFRHYLNIITNNYSNNIFDSNIRKELLELESELSETVRTNTDHTCDTITQSSTVTTIGDEFTCSLCSKAFRTLSSMNSHLKTHFKSNSLRNNNGIKCTRDGCSKRLKTWKTLKEHQLTVHSIDPPFKCKFPNCSMSYRTYHSLNAHKMVHTNQYLRCDWPGCEYQTKRGVSLREHVLIHTGEKNHACHMCEKRCRTARLLREHVLTHSATPLFKCTHPGCSSAFPYYKSLYNHKFQHCVEKPFVCQWPGCDFKTVHRYVLKTHKMKHTDDRPHACSLCNMRFRQSHHLKTHMLKHTGDKPHECDWPGCDRKYQSRQALRIHLEKCHQNSKQLVVAMTTTTSADCV